MRMVKTVGGGNAYCNVCFPDGNANGKDFLPEISREGDECYCGECGG